MTIHTGQRLYLAARAGETVERQHRAISVSRFDLWRDEPGAQDVHFRVACSKGTYIRALAHDLVRRRLLAPSQHGAVVSCQQPNAHAAVDRSMRRCQGGFSPSEREAAMCYRQPDAHAPVVARSTARCDTCLARPGLACLEFVGSLITGRMELELQGQAAGAARPRVAGMESVGRVLRKMPGTAGPGRGLGSAPGGAAWSLWAISCVDS